MKEKKPPIIDLDPSELLGLSQVAKVTADPTAAAKLLSKVGETPSGKPSFRLGRLLSKIGEVPG